MIAFLILALFSEVMVLGYFDRQLSKHRLTPFTVVAIPFLLVVVLAYIFAEALGFVALRAEAILVWMVGLGLFWMGGLPVLLMLHRHGRAPAIDPRESEAQFLTPFMVLGWAAVALVAFLLIVAIGEVGGVGQIGSLQFAALYGSGVGGHLLEFLKLMLILVLGSDRYKRPAYLCFVCAVVVLLLPYHSKGSLLLPLSAALFYRLLSRRSRLTLAKVAFIPFAAVIIFIAIYFVGYGERLSTAIYDIDNYLFLLEHFCFYVFAGVLGLGEAIHYGVGIQAADGMLLFAPAINLVRALRGEEVLNIATLYFSEVGTGRHSNVHTLFGTVLLFEGPLLGALITILLGFVMYCFYGWALRSSSCWALASLSLMMSALAFGWFEFYFWALTFYEVTAYCLAVVLGAAWVRDIPSYKQPELN